MSGKNKIGRRLERLVAAMLKEAGWTVRIVEPSIKYLARQKRYISRPQDIFGADIIGLRKDSPVLFVQVTAHPGVKKRIEEFTKYPFPFPMANDNLTKIRPGNVKNFEIRCDFCGYTLKGNFVNDIVCRANDLGWKYDYENDRVICRNCQKESKMNNNLLALIDGRDKAKASVAAYEKRIMETICEAIRDVIPGIKARCDYCHSERIVFYTEAMSEEAPEKITVTIVNQKDRDFWLSSVITDVFPALGGSVDDVSICLSQEERDEIMKRLKKLRGSMEGDE